MKAKILSEARRVFGRYGYHGATTRIIARAVGIDVSTLYYHWGEKSDLYEAVIADVTEDLRQQLRTVEKAIHGRPLRQRMAKAIELMTDYLFEHPEIPNLILFRYFSQTRLEMELDARVPELFVDIARSMGLADAHGVVSVSTKMRVLAMAMANCNFVSGEDFFRSMLDLNREEYIPLVKETLKFVLIPAFAGQ
ncbi:MAG: TetR/AcrR family transcriptional regulator [Deltaproteobacteria bacterium]|nr:TetR/AcrR family transcriptional regulator [Deltaproteobacteria bacterium]